MTFFQPMGALKFQHSVNLRWNFLYRTGSRPLVRLGWNSAWKCVVIPRTS